MAIKKFHHFNSQEISNNNTSRSFFEEQYNLKQKTKTNTLDSSSILINVDDQTNDDLYNLSFENEGNHFLKSPTRYTN